MVYDIEWIARKDTQSGKPKCEARLKGADGTLHEKVNIWGDFPNFANLMNGGKVEGVLTPASDPKYPPSLKPIQSAPSGAPRGLGGTFKTAQIEKAQDTKRADIANAQETKNDHIRIAAAQRDAVLVVTNFYQHVSEDRVMTEEERERIIKKKIIELRDWFLSTEFSNTLPFS